MKLIKLCIIFLLSLSYIKAGAQKQMLYADAVYEPNIKSVRLLNTGVQDPVPVFSLGSREALILTFDELTANNDYYQYTLIHCDYQWNKSDLQPQEYLDGAFFEEIRDFKFSRNTFTQYVNYQVRIPGNEMKPRISGNYILKVYRNFDESDVILTRRFFVINPKVSISGEVKPATLAEFRYNRQEVDFTVNTNKAIIPNPFQDAKVVVMQNFRTDNAKYNLVPLFINGSELIYNYESENVFEGTNEFRFFDFRTLRNLSPNIRRKDKDEQNNTWLTLYTDELRGYQRYVFWNDFNGKMVIENKDGVNAANDGEYCYVNFSFLTNNKLADDVYVFGELSNWQVSDEYKMIWNGTNGYDATLLLKQGYYNYLYVTMSGNTERPNYVETSFTEGNYAETENDYYIFFYVRNQAFNYFEIYGYQKLNSNS